MTTTYQKNLFGGDSRWDTRHPASQTTWRIPKRITGRANSFAVLFFVSAAVFAQAHNTANGITQLPESYRTPLSDMIYDDNPKWRLLPEDENPWRENKEDELIKPRIKAEFFPQYNYESVEDPNPGPLFQNEYELDKPVSNIFKYTF